VDSFDRSRIILGAGNFGGVGSLPALIGRGESTSMARRLLDRAVELGITRFDTANTYGGGESEVILGDWLRDQSAPLRQRIQITTKVGNPYGCGDGERPLSRRQIEFHLERSLRRLAIEQLSVYYLHEQDGLTPLEETLEAFSAAIDRGLIAGFGLSNFNLENVQRVLDTAGQSLASKLTHVQNEFHFLHQSDRDPLIPFLSLRKIKYVAFSPLAGGLLTGKYQQVEAPPEGSRLSLRPEPYQRFLSQEGLSKISGFLEDARRSEKSPSEAALRFVLDTPGVHFVIIGPRKLEHYESLGFKFNSA
jgi:aryl-alcohol dehydrogenase-like predicted oxidoreductase